MYTRGLLALPLHYAHYAVYMCVCLRPAILCLCYVITMQYTCVYACDLLALPLHCTHYAVYMCVCLTMLRCDATDTVYITRPFNYTVF